MVDFNKNSFKPHLVVMKDKYFEMYHNKKGKDCLKVPEDTEKGAAGPGSDRCRVVHHAFTQE
jgi:hypothetical protein